MKKEDKKLLWEKYDLVGYYLAHYKYMDDLIMPVIKRDLKKCKTMGGWLNEQSEEALDDFEIGKW